MGGLWGACTPSMGCHSVLNPTGFRLRTDTIAGW